jgi:DNA-binding LacI/PurR family transcriptional regulator
MFRTTLPATVATCGIAASSASAAGVELIEGVQSDKPQMDAQFWLGQLTPERAVIARSHAQSESLFTVAASAGKVAGRQYALVCCDDRSWYQRGVNQLSRSTSSRHEMERIAARMLLGRVEEPDSSSPSQVVRPTWHSMDDAASPVRPTLVPLNELLTAGHTDF